VTDNQLPVDDESSDEIVDQHEEVGPIDPIDPIDPTNENMVETARQRYGKGGAAMAAGMFGLDVALGLKKKPESVQVQEASSKPVNLDSDGFEMPIDASTTVATPALERRPPIGVGKRKSRRS
jgi:hypothetical protein